MASANNGSVMYTEAMRKAFHSIEPPKGFSVDILDNEMFLTVRINERLFFSLSDWEKRQAIEYVMKVKKALEDNGAVVLVVRKSYGK
jgi:hypothetical protein